MVNFSPTNFYSMKKTMTLLLPLLSMWLMAQTHRFTYEYRYIPNINEKEKVMSDQMALDISSAGSEYRSLGKMAMDSILRAQIKGIEKGGGMNIDMRGTRKPGMVDYEVKKEYPDYKVSLMQRVGRDLYKIAEDEKPIWKIAPDKQKIGEYMAQKATTDFGGRSWVAWFAAELPFPDGPYKFYGLPGLIVKIEDTTGSHSMTLIGNRKINEAAKEEETNFAGGKFSFSQPSISVTEPQFRKMWKNYILDPGKEWRNGNSTSADGMTRSMVIMRDASGKQIDQKDIAKTVEASTKARLAKDNNRIEPALYDAKE